MIPALGGTAGIYDHVRAKWPEMRSLPGPYRLLLTLRVLEGHGALGTAYRMGLGLGSDAVRAALSEADEHDLRRAARMLSPVTPGGLGTFDHLDVAEEIERL